MEVISAILFFVAGVVVGGFATRYWLSSQVNTSTPQSDEQTIKDILAQQTGTHLLESRQMVDNIRQQCDALKQQFEHFESLVEETQNPDDENKLRFFGDQANAYLRHHKSDHKPEKPYADFQPLDYAGGNSGMFNDDKKSKAQTTE